MNAPRYDTAWHSYWYIGTYNVQQLIQKLDKFAGGVFVERRWMKMSNYISVITIWFFHKIELAQAMEYFLIVYLPIGKSLAIDYK